MLRVCQSEDGYKQEPRNQGRKFFVYHNLIPGVLSHKQRLPVIHPTTLIRRQSRSTNTVERCLSSWLEWYDDFYETTAPAFRPWTNSTENTVCDSFHSTARLPVSHAPARALPSHASVQSSDPEPRIHTPSVPPTHRVPKSQRWHVVLEFCRRLLDRWRPGDDQDSPQWPDLPRKVFLRAG